MCAPVRNTRARGCGICGGYCRCATTTRNTIHLERPAQSFHDAAQYHAAAWEAVRVSSSSSSPTTTTTAAIIAVIGDCCLVIAAAAAAAAAKQRHNELLFSTQCLVDGREKGSRRGHGQDVVSSAKHPHKHTHTYISKAPPPPHLVHPCQHVCQVALWVVCVHLHWARCAPRASSC